MKPTMVPILVARALLATACGKGQETVDRPDLPAKELRVAEVAGALPVDDPFSDRWDAAREVLVPMVVQDVTEPRLTEAGVPTVSVRALRDGARIALRLEWADDAVDDLADTDRSVDQVAVQVPAVGDAEGIPDAMMGEEGKPVSITLWRASWQRRVDGGTWGIKALYPNALIDHYPENAAKDPGDHQTLARLYNPPGAVGNPVVADPGTRPVEDLTATGVGTLRPDPDGASTGKGVYRDGRWHVVIARPLAVAPGARTRLRPGESTLFAVAVWNGSADNRGSKKMRSVWIPLVMGKVGP